MKLIVVTNNSLVYDTMSGKKIFSEIVLDAGSSGEGILKLSKSMIIKGHHLLINPFFGNIPPYEMPFKTIVLSERRSVIAFDSLNIINSALQKAQRSIDERTNAGWSKSDLADFKKNDLVIIERWLVKVYLPANSKNRRAKNGNG